MELKKTLNKTVGKTVSIFIFAIFMLGIIYTVGTIAPLLDTGGNETVTTTQEVSYTDGWLDTALGTDGLVELSNGYVGIDDNRSHGEAVVDATTSTVLDDGLLEADDGEVQMYVSMNALNESDTDSVALTFENPDTGDSFVHEFNVSELSAHVSQNGQARFYETVPASNFDVLQNDGDDSFEFKLSGDRINTVGTSEGDWENVGFGIEWTTSTTETSEGFVGDSLLTNMGGLVLALGGLIGLMVVLFMAITE